MLGPHGQVAILRMKDAIRPCDATEKERYLKAESLMRNTSEGNCVLQSFFEKEYFVSMCNSFLTN